MRKPRSGNQRGYFLKGEGKMIIEKENLKKLSRWGNFLNKALSGHLDSKIEKLKKVDLKEREIYFIKLYQERKNKINHIIYIFIKYKKEYTFLKLEKKGRRKNGGEKCSPTFSQRWKS